MPTGLASQSRSFYTEAFSFKLVSNIGVTENGVAENHYSEPKRIKPTRTRRVTLQLGDEAIELMEYPGVAGKPIPTDSQSNDTNFQK